MGSGEYKLMFVYFFVAVIAFIAGLLIGYSAGVEPVYDEDDYYDEFHE